ncbi:unnamed protein product [Caenorhabditis nigoni]|uniref:Aftiphilin clathrin-binding box domain-containing protein n=1 Tax=Caenorhabditis nigoni TaxID=1611254 RepID=A0A2G5TAA2_9PELO|nr:hypothetical protein B9Z55_017564 [Caenorhabditis nigoni]
MASNDEDDDDWGAFDQARPSTDRSDESSQQLAHQQSLEEWGAFEETQKTSTNDDVDDDEWQAEFSSASTATTVIPSENLKALEEMLEDDAFWDDGYCEAMELEETQNADPLDIPALFDTEELKELSNEFEDLEKAKYSKLWLSLRFIEEAISLKFDWKQSEIKRNHFKALKIQPITVKKETRATAAAIFDTSNLLLPIPITQHSTSSEDQQKTLTSPAVDSPSVPAVDFDWDTSGLTNPMNRANQCSAIIDVDFLGSNGVATAYTSTLQQDLEQFGLTNGSAKSNSNGSSILENLMSRTNGSTSRYRTPEVLSLDARQLLERLPDLQYLQSEVLMFPVGTNLPH